MRMPKILSLTRLAIFLPVAIIALFATPVRAVANEIVNPTFSSSGGGWAGASGGASCSSGNPSLGQWQANALNFSYVWNVVTQTVNISEPSLVEFSYTVQDRQEEYINGRYSVTVSDSNETVTTGITIAENQATTNTLSVRTTQPNEVVTISIAGDDNGLFWAGCYGPIFTNTELDVLAVSSVWIELNEGWSGTISANGGTFTSVIFASYGTPSGSSGTYSIGSCHAQNSQSVVEGALLGQTSAVLAASNGVFGDPCGGTYKRLYVLAEYAGGTPPTTSTTTTIPPPSCGPYENITVTGKLNGAVWGSGPYTDDSDFGVVVVHAGLAEVGQTVTLVPSAIAYYLSFPGSTANGVTTNDWLSGWCGYNVSMFVTPTTITSSTTTTTEPQTTTTENQTTTTEPQTTTTENQTTTTEEQTATTELSTTTTELILDETTTTEVDIPTQTTIEEKDSDSTVPPKTEEPDEPAQETTVPEPAPVQENEEETAPVVIEQTSTEELINDLISGDATDEQVDAFLDDVLSDGVTAEAVEAVVDIINTGSLDDEQVQEIVAEILAEEITNDQAVQLATSPELLASITQDQAEEIFASIDTGELSEEQASQIVAAVQNAVESVRKAFETEINVFGGKFDTYVPTGSRVTVAERRVVVAAGAVLFMAPVVTTSSINTTSNNSAPNRKQ